MRLRLLMLLLLLPAPLLAQTGTVTGVALDNNANTVAGATITICPQGSPGIPCTPVVASATSNGQGAFAVTVPVGTYTVTVFRSGIVATSSTVVVAPSNITVANNVVYSGTVTFNQPIISTVSTGTAPFSIASATVVPNLNAQLHGGLAAPSSAILGLTDAQAPTNKTFDISANTLKNSSNTAGHYPRNNGTNYVDAAIATADLPATTSNCSGVQYAQGLNAGDTPICTTPPTFVASGASHAVGYVPDPGSSAGTTRFLREDASWQTVSGGVSEATWSTAQFSFASAITQAQTILPNAHTLERFTIFVQLTLGSCTTSPVLAFKDITANSVLASFTVANATPFTDSGALSVAMTAGDTFGFVTTTAGVSCTGGSNATITAVFK